MNLYLYTLLARTMKRTATRLRIAGGSAVGAAFFVLWILIPGMPVALKRFAGPMLISLLTAAAVLRLKSFALVWKAAGYLSIYTFAFGGMMRFLFAGVPFLQGKQKGVWYILGAGMLAYYVVSWWIAQMQKRQSTDIYKVRLWDGRTEIELDALLDSGNSLREPISGKPVSVIEEGSFQRLRGIRCPEKLKVIPYHSVGKANGIMEGYEIPRIRIEGPEEELQWQDVIVSISKNRISANGRYQMILHPDLCRGVSGGRKSRPAAMAGAPGAAKVWYKSDKNRKVQEGN